MGSGALFAASGSVWLCHLHSKEPRHGHWYSRSAAKGNFFKIIMTFYPFLLLSVALCLCDLMELCAVQGSPREVPGAFVTAAEGGRLPPREGRRLLDHSAHKYQTRPAGRNLGWE